MIRILFAALVALSWLDTAAAQDTTAPVRQTQDNQSSEERWPRSEISDEARSEINEKFDGPFSAYHDDSYKSFLANHQPFGDYLRWSQRTYSNDGELILDAAGMPRVLHQGVPYYNPVTLSHYALTLYGRLINGDQNARAPFLAAVRKFISLQSPDGAFRYPIRLQHHHFTFEPGWVSGMAQGNALSVFARALQVENDPSFRRAGELALAALLRTTAEGGTATTLADLDPSLGKYIFFEEYPSKPIPYTLNGYMFTLLGLFDWGHVKEPSSARAAQAFASGMVTLEKILPLYDVDGLSTYDLSHIVFRQKPYTPTAYPAIHLYLLHALNSITHNPTIERFEKSWTEKIEQLNKTLRFVRLDFSPASPQPAGKPITIKVRADSDPPTPRKLYQFEIKHDGEWTTAQPYSENNTFVWTPEAEGQYWISFLTKAADSTGNYDNLRVLPYEVTAAPPGTEVALLRLSVKNITAELSQTRKQVAAMTSELALARAQLSQLEGELKGMQGQQKRDADAAQKERLDIAHSLDQQARNAEAAQKERFDIARSIDRRMDELKASSEKFQADFEAYRSKWWWQR